MPGNDDHGERLFAWAVLAPVLIQHYSIVVPSDLEVWVCACSPGVRRSIDEWARHVSDQVAASIG
jgi:hypothetical protein